MKKGSAVKFVGNETRSPYNKTYIWQVVNISENEIGYIIEHPEGTLLNEQTEKTDFTGIDTKKLHQGKRYMMAYATELIDLDAIAEAEKPKEAVVIPITPELDNTEISLSLPKHVWESISNAVLTYKEITTQHKTLIIASGQLTEQDLNKSFEDCDKFVVLTQTQGINV